MKIKKRLKDKAGMLVLTAVLVVAALIVSVVSGCTEQVKAAENEVSAETSVDTDNSSHKETKTTDADKNGSKNAQVSDSDKSADKGSDKTDKTETVYAKADASGKVYDVSVEAVLKNEGEGEITDYSTLSDIKNTEGDEEFTEKGSNVIVWENHGEDIHYKGTSTDALPVDVKITYYLNDKQVTADELKGQSGKVRIRFDYTNKSSLKVEVNGKTVEVSTPFVVCSAMFLSSDNFSNIEVTNGKTVEMDDQNIVIGYAMPGLSDSLQLKDYEATEDVDIPEYVELTADVTDFSLDFTATIISNGMFGDMDTDDLKDVDDLIDAMDDLSEASGKLMDGTAELADGADELGDYFGQYLTGVSALDEGSAGLMQGLKAVNDQKGTLLEGAKGLQQGLETLNQSLATVNLDGQSVDMQPMSAAAAALGQDAAKLKEALTAMQSTLNDVKTFANDAKSYKESVQKKTSEAKGALDAVDLSEAEKKAESEAKEQASKAVKEALAGTDLTDDQKAEIQSKVKDSISISDTTDTASGKVAEAKDALKDMPDLEIPEFSLGTDTITVLVEDMQKQLQVLGQYSEALSNLGTQMSGLSGTLEQLKTGVSSLADGSGQLTAGVQALNDGIEQLYQGSVALNNGTVQLITAGNAISKGFDGLSEGTDALSDGMKEFDKEGIQELKKLAGDDLENIITRVRALKKADEQYNNFSGLEKGKTGSVRFIVETDEIKK